MEIPGKDHHTADSRIMTGGASSPILLWLLGAVVCLGAVGAVFFALIPGSAQVEVAQSAVAVQPAGVPAAPEAAPEEVPAALPTGECRDTDGGKVVSRFGMITGEEASGELLMERDRCLDARTLQEFWCEGAQLKRELFDCLGAEVSGEVFAGCSLGRCVSEMPGQAPPPEEEVQLDPEVVTPEPPPSKRTRRPVRTCTDSDRGGKIFRKGRTAGKDRSGKPFAFTDHCQDERHVTEYWCERGQLIEQTFDCLDPKFASYRFRACRAGSCVK